jgi:hypothetical protein
MKPFGLAAFCNGRKITTQHPVPQDLLGKSAVTISG